VIKEQCGTPAYIAPEIIGDEGYSGFSVDIWSLGVLLYAMLQGTVPFKATNMKELHTLINKGKFGFPCEVSSEAEDLIRKMLVKAPKERLSFPEILSHPWMIGMDLDDFETDMMTDVQLSRNKCGVMTDDQSGKHGINMINVDNLFPEARYDVKLSYAEFVNITQDYQTMYIDEEALRVIEKFGYPKSFVRECIRNGDINHATTCYHLLTSSD
jgi:serine/threonine protein kinase